MDASGNTPSEAADASLSPPAVAARPPGETVKAVRNALTLGASLAATWTVALVVKLLLPRTLGPLVLGQYNFADAAAANIFVFLGLGLDTYIQKEIPARPDHASDFLGGAFATRALLSLVLFGALSFEVLRSGRPNEVLRTAFVLGCVQVVMCCAATFATLLYAAQTVGRLAVLNVASKLTWAGGVGVALALHASLEWYAIALLASETLRLVVLYRIVRRSLVLRVDFAGTWKVLVKSAPFFATTVAAALYTRIDVNIMSIIMPDEEVGYYGAAANISSVAMLMAPLMGWVLMPQLARAAARSREELDQMFRRSIEWTLAVAIPVSMMLVLAADQIVIDVFKAKFLPAIAALRVLSTIFVPVYVAMLGSTYLNLTDRSWQVTLVTVGSLIFNALLNLVVIRPAFQTFGAGGAGFGAAITSVLSEIVVAGVFLFIIGRKGWDKRAVVCLAKSVACCVLTCCVHTALARLGPARIIVDGLCYLVLVVVTGALNLRELYDAVRSAVSRRTQAAA